LGSTKQELHHTRVQLDSARERLADCKIRVGVLTERIHSHRRMRHLKNVSIAFGSLLVPIGVDLNDRIDMYSYVVVSLGVLLIVLGWFVIDGETEE
jgi:hypothetical protein